jgi:hypothetical protein
MTEDTVLSNQSVLPTDITEWLSIHGWTQTASLGDIAQRWQNETSGVVVPMRAASPDFSLRWSEMLNRLAHSFDTNAAGLLLEVTKAGSDIAEFEVSGQIDDSIPLGDAAILIDSVRRVVQASANAALQPRSYYGHSIPDAAREHARNVRMGQTRRGSYIVPVISRLPTLRSDDTDDAVLFEDRVFRPFARSAMLKLAEGLAALRELTHGPTTPANSVINESVGAGVSSELCDAVANTLETASIADLDIAFSWAGRLPAPPAPESLRLENEATPLIRTISSFLKGESVVGHQTMVGYVKRLDRGEDDEIGRITLRVLDQDKARNLTMDVNDADYHVAGEANTERRMVAATGILHRESGRALRFTRVDDFHLVEGLPGI